MTGATTRAEAPALDLSMDRWPMVGRDEELAFATSAVRGPGRAGLVIAGAAGVGKTRLAREIVKICAADGTRVCQAVANQWTATVPYAALLPLLPDDIGVVDGTEGLARVRAAVTRGERFVLWIDDAHLLDEASATLVQQLAVTRASTTILTITLGQQAPQPIRYLWKEGVLPRLELQPITRHETADLVEHVLDGVVAPATQARLWNATHGNLLMLNEVLLLGRESGALEQRDGVWRWHGPLDPGPRLVELVHTRLGKLNDVEQRVVVRLALAEPLPLEALLEVCPLATLATLERRDVLRVSTTEPCEARFAHPLYADVVRSQIPLLTQRELAAELVDVLERQSPSRPDELARLASLYWTSGVSGNPELLVAAARQATATADPELGERLAKRALEVAQNSFDARFALAESLVCQGRHEATDVALAELTRIAGNDDQLTHVARLWTSANVIARDEVAEYVDRGLSDVEARVQSHHGRSAVGVERARHAAYLGDAKGAGVLALPVADDAAVSRDVRLRAAMPAAIALLVSGRATACMELADRLLPVVIHRDDGTEEPMYSIAFIRLLGLLYAGWLHDADQVAATLQQHVLHKPSEQRGDFLLGFGAVALKQGRIRSAIRLLLAGRAALLYDDPDGWLVWGLALLAEAYATAGDVREAEAALGELDEKARSRPTLLHSARHVAGAWLDAAKGNLDKARTAAIDLADRSRATGAVFDELLGLHTALRFGESGVALRSIEVAAQVEGPWASAVALHASGLAKHDAALLERAAIAFEATGSPLLAAETSASAARTYFQCGYSSHAHASQRRAEQLRGACESSRTPALSQSLAVAALTAREEEIGMLAARGLTNRDIAQRLCVSVRTVEGHLNRMFPKLGIRSRAEIADLFGAASVAVSGRAKELALAVSPMSLPLRQIDT